MLNFDGNGKEAGVENNRDIRLEASWALTRSRLEFFSFPFPFLLHNDCCHMTTHNPQAGVFSRSSQDFSVWGCRCYARLALCNCRTARARLGPRWDYSKLEFYIKALGGKSRLELVAGEPFA